METLNTNWTRATTNVDEAFLGLSSCLENNKNAWIEIMKNGDQDFPVMKKNPLLDNPFYWAASYGIPKNKNEMNRIYFNDTEKDLTENWINCFGTKESIEKYQNDGVVTEGLLLSKGYPHPVRIKDANWYRKYITGDNYDYKNFWMYLWKPADGIDYWIVDEDIKEVFVVCYNDSDFDKKKMQLKAGMFILKRASL